MRLHALMNIALFLVAGSVSADKVLYRYEGDVLPYADSPGWIIANPCEEPCTEFLEDGHYVLAWPEAGDLVNLDYEIAQPPDPAPPSLWVEWRFRSNHPLGEIFFSCDAKFSVHYEGIHDRVQMYGDAVISFSGDDFVLGLAIDEFHTYHFESVDGVHYSFSVDGLPFFEGVMATPNGYHYLQFGGRGGCISDQIPNMVNEWDFIRFGTIAYGEQIVGSDPPSGFLDARKHATLDRFTVTFEEPNYVYLDEITVDVTGGVPPIVTQTRRLEDGSPNTVEIVLDRPVPMRETTTFTFNDGEAINVIKYTFVPGDTNGDGLVNLADIAAFQRCFGLTDLAGACLALDLVPDDAITLEDLAALNGVFGVR